MKLIRVYAVWITIIFAVLIGFSLVLGRSNPHDIVAFQSNYEGDDEIYIADLTVGFVRNLTHDPITLNQNPLWSPDGRYIMSVSKEAGWTTYVRDVITGETRKLFEDGHGLRRAWSPDARWLAYIDDVGSLTGGKSGLYLMNMLSGDVRLLTDQIITRSRPFWSPDSQKIAFVSYNQRLNFPIHIIDISSGTINDLSNNSKGLVTQDAISWSPDNRQIVYTMGSGANVSLYITDIETGHIKRIGNHIGFDALDDVPAWSPDGRQIAFQSYRDKSRGLYLVDVATGETRFLTRTDGRLNPLWSPTGRMLGFSLTDIYTDVYVIDVETGKTTLVWNSPGDKSNLAWSPPWQFGG
ncbi:MAG: PD40 domain-containing protein [Anaerolineae bacterium]|nr:PD40 domain-containing protein [Anaerolineae bacterium]